LTLPFYYNSTSISSSRRNPLPSLVKSLSLFFPLVLGLYSYFSHEDLRDHPSTSLKRRERASNRPWLNFFSRPFNFPFLFRSISPSENKGIDAPQSFRPINFLRGLSLPLGTGFFCAFPINLNSNPIFLILYFPPPPPLLSGVSLRLDFFGGGVLSVPGFRPSILTPDRPSLRDCCSHLAMSRGRSPRAQSPLVLFPISLSNCPPFFFSFLDIWRLVYAFSGRSAVGRAVGWALGIHPLLVPRLKFSVPSASPGVYTPPILRLFFDVLSLL